jgi:hypothetical protein
MKHTPLTFIALCLAAWLLLAANTAVFADSTLTVYPGEVAIADNGRCSLREAIINANNDAATHPDCPAGTGDDTIIIPAGIYILSDATAPNEDFSVTGDLDIHSNITLQGAGASATILDGNQTDRVLHVATSSAVVVVNDLTIRNGRSPAGADNPIGCTSGVCYSNGEDGSPGGGIFSVGTLTLNRVLVIDNQTGDGGNGGDLSCSSPEDGCSTIGGNGGDGAGIASSGPSLTIHNSVIQDNRTGNGGVAGANNCIGGATCSVLSSQQGDGGGINMRGGNDLTMTLSHVSHNSGGFGGGVSCEGTCTITQSSIQNNSATVNGGGLYLSHNSPKVISHTTVANNTTTENGGGIFVNQGTVTISNVTLSGNAADLNGGGIVNNSATTTLNHVTIANNTADADSDGSGDGGGIFKFGTLNLKNSVVADNSATGGQAPDCAGTITSQFYNHIGNLTGCTFTPGTGDVTGSDPNLGLLADNGGIGQTHRPNVGSPLLTPLHRIPNGVNDCGDVITVDQRGAARPFGGSCAKGAVEVRETIPSSSCGGADLSGTQEFDFTSGNTVTVTITTANELNCITVEEMGSDHPAATGTMGDSGIYTGNWWHISGNIDSGFEVTVTLPHSGLGNPQVCKYPGTEGGYGWDCARTGADGSTVWLNGVDSFSDWAVGDNVGPTAVSTLHTQISTPNQTTLVITTILATLLALFSGAALWLRRTV